jgi:hypothetical protein
MARQTSMPDRGDKWEKQLGPHLGPSQWYLDHDEEYLAHDLDVCGRSAWLPKFLNRIAEHEHAYLNSKDQRAVLDTIRLCLLFEEPVPDWAKNAFFGVLTKARRGE